MNGMLPELPHNTASPTVVPHNSTYAKRPVSTSNVAFDYPDQRKDQIKWYLAVRG